MEHITKKQFAESSFWKMVEQFSGKMVTFIVSLVLARLLVPDDYGIISITTVFLSITDILIQGGFGTSLIRKKTINDAEISTVFYVNLIIAALLYIIIFFISPYVAAYYNRKILCIVLRVISIVLFFQAFSAVRSAIVIRQMKFKLLCVNNLVSSVISGTAGVLLAFFGYGVWALVLQQIIQQMLINILLFILVKWKPSLDFSISSAKQLFSFGIGVLGSSVIDTTANSAYNIGIGKVYSLTDLGFYNRGFQLPQMISQYTFTAISSVLLPTFASFQNEPLKLKYIYKRVLSTTCYVVFPMMTGMAAIGNNLILLLFTEKWLPSVGVYCWYCLIFSLNPLRGMNSQIFYAIGKSEINMRIELIRFLLMVALLVFSIVVKANIYFISMGLYIVMLFTILFSQLEIRKIISYSLKEWIKDIIFPLLASATMVLCIFIIGQIKMNYIVLMLIQVVIGCVFYLLVSVLFRVPAYLEIKSMLKSLKVRGKNVEVANYL